jgi:hypothetical protein
MVFRIRIAFLLFLLIGCIPRKGDGVLEMHFLDDEIKIKLFDRDYNEPCESMCANVRFSLRNNSKSDYILYNFKRDFQFSEIGDSLFCNPEAIGVVKFLFVVDSKNTPINPSFFISDKIGQHGPDSLMKKIKKGIDAYRKEKQVIRHGEELVFAFKIDFLRFRLEAGEYVIKVIYMQYNVPEYFVSPSEIIEDENEYGARLFNGCLIADGLKLTVER